MYSLNRLDKILHKAVEIAKTSEGVGGNRNYRIGAVLFDDKRIITAKCNSYKTHPLALKFSIYPHLHAELSCLISAGLDDVKDKDILITRILSDGRITMAKPCKFCQKALDYTKVRNVYYTNWDGILCLNSNQVMK